MLLALLSITVLTVTFTLISFIGEQKKPEFDQGSKVKESVEVKKASREPSKVMGMQPLPAISEKSISLKMDSLVPLGGRERLKNKEEEHKMKR